MCAFVYGGSALVFISLPAPGFSQGTEIHIEEIMVTAQKREEGLQDVPIAIGVVTGHDIEQMSLRNLEEISVSMPGFHVHQSPAQSGIFIRSIGSGANNQGFEQSVGLFIDGVYAGRERIFQALFLDIERVEVIKGPQSVILGKNTTGGAVNITTARPTDHFEGYLSALYGDDREYEAIAILSGPLSDTLAVRGAVRASGMDGYIRNTLTGDDEPAVDDLAVRGTMRWQPTDNLTADFKAEYARARQDGNALVPALLTPGQLALAQMFDPEIVVDIDSQTKSADSETLPGGEEYNDLDSYNVTLTIDYAFSDWMLTSITSFAGLEFEQGTDGDHLPIPLAAISLTIGSEYEQYSQELRLASPVAEDFEFMGGLYFQHGDTGFLDWIPCVDFASVPGPGLPSSFCAPAQWSQTQNTASAFMRGTLNLTDSLRAATGIRYTHEKKDADSTLTVTTLDGVTPNTNPFDLAIASAVGGWATHTIPETGRTEKNWSPSFNLQYDVTPEAMIYASYVRGTKGGGFNPQNGTGDLDAWQFEAEKARSFEIGAKTRLFGNRAVFNVAAFTTKVSDFQVSQFNGITFDVSNAGSAEVDGVEFDFRLRATEDLTLSGSASYLDSRYGSFITAPCQNGQTAAAGCVGGFQDLSGETLPFAPDWSANFAADYSRPIANGLRLNLYTDLYYSSEQLLGPDLDPRTRQADYTKINARIGIGGADEQWEVAVVGKNLTDKVTKNFQNDIIGFGGAFFAHVTRGRSFAVQGTVRF
jgi:outer membrane receptor protein involved in Fe transport